MSLHATTTAHQAQVTNAAGRVIAADQFDDYGRIVSRTDVFGATSSIDYNTAGLPAVLTDPLGAPTRFDYDQVGHLSAITSPTGLQERYSYDAAGRLASTTDPTGAVTRYLYDADSRLTGIIDPTGVATEYSWDLWVGSSKRVPARSSPLPLTMTCADDPRAPGIRSPEPGTSVTTPLAASSRSRCCRPSPPLHLGQTRTTGHHHQRRRADHLSIQPARPDRRIHRSRRRNPPLHLEPGRRLTSHTGLMASRPATTRAAGQKQSPLTVRFLPASGGT